MPTADDLWREEFGPRYAKAKYREDVAREHAFLDHLTHLIAGESVRTLTPRDVVLLHRLGCPLFYPEAELLPAHLLQFIWALHVDNAGSLCRRLYRRARFIRRHRAAGADSEAFRALLEDCQRYLQEMYLDAPSARSRGACESRPLGIFWIAGLLSDLAEKMGAIDPLSGLPLGECPLPRLWQYHKSIRARELGDKLHDFSPSDAILSEWLEATQKTTRPVPATSAAS